LVGQREDCILQPPFDHQRRLPNCQRVFHGLSISRTNLCIDTKAERVESKAIARECAGTFEGQGIFAALQLEDLNIANRP